MNTFQGELTIKKSLLYVFIGIVGLLAVKILLSLIPLGIILFLFLAPPAFVLADSQERGVKRPLLWAVFTLFTSVFGLLVYLLARPETADKSFCPFCGGAVDPSFHNCPWCGKAHNLTGKCRKCETELKTGWKFCPKCQVPVEAAEDATTAKGA